jgi:hypothetical protein
MKKHKSRSHPARIDVMRRNAANARRKQRHAARKSYDRRAYDKPQEAV